MSIIICYLVALFLNSFKFFIMPDGTSGNSGALIASIVAPAAASLVNSFGALGSNRANRRFSREMYERTKSDNLAFWNQQNAYNSPAAQMQRFKDAGLNPALIYGQGTPGNAAPIPTPDVQRVDARNPEWGNAVSAGGLGYLNAIYDLEIKQAQANNLKAQNTVIMQDARLREAQILATQTGAERSKFNLDFESELRPISAEARKEQLRQLKISTDLSVNRDLREALTNAQSLQEAGERILNMRVSRDQTGAEIQRIQENVRQMKLDGTLKQLDIDLKRNGIMPSDPMYARIAGRILAGSSVSDLKSSFSRGMDSFWNFFKQ